MIRCDHCGQDKEVVVDNKYSEGYNAGYLDATQSVLTIIYGKDLPGPSIWDRIKALFPHLVKE